VKASFAKSIANNPLATAALVPGDTVNPPKFKAVTL
jgi:hypothetical protein